MEFGLPYQGSVIFVLKTFLYDFSSGLFFSIGYFLLW